MAMESRARSWLHGHGNASTHRRRRVDLEQVWLQLVVEQQIVPASVDSTPTQGCISPCDGRATLAFGSASLTHPYNSKQCLSLIMIFCTDSSARMMMA